MATDSTQPLQIPITTVGEAQSVASLTRVQGAVRNLASGVEGMARRFQQSFGGIAAGLGALTAFFGTAGVRASLAAWRETSVSMRELEFQLRRSGKAAAETTTELNALADALEESTGVDDAKVRTVMRILLAQGNQIAQVKELTPLLLDLAAAMEVDAVSAARMVGAQLAEGNISIKRLGISAKTTEELIGQLTSRIQGQAAASFAAQGSTGTLAVAFGNTKEEVGALIELPLFAFLEGFVAGVKRVTAAISEWKRENETLYQSIIKAFGNAGGMIGAHIDKIVLAVGSYAALRTAMMLVNGVTSVFTGLSAGAFTAALASNIKGVSALSAEVGVLRAALVGVWGVLSTVIAAGASAWAGWEIGKLASQFVILGSTIEDQVVKHLLRLKLVWMGVQESIGLGSEENRSEMALLAAEIEGTTKAAQDAAVALDAALDAAMAKRAEAEAAGGAGGAGAGGGAAQREVNEAAIRGKGLLAVEEEQLRRGAELLQADLERKRVTLDDFAQIRAEQIETVYQQEILRLYQVAAEAEDKAKAQIELEEGLKLAHERFITELLRLDTDLSNKRDALRREDLQKELAANEQRLSAARDQISEQRTREQNSFRMGREEKRSREIASLRSEAAVIDESIRGAERGLGAETDPAARASREQSLRGMQSERRGIGAQLATAEETPDPNSITDQFESAITRMEDRLNTFAEGVANVFSSVIQGAVDGIAGSIEGLLKGTMDWADALRNIGGSIFNAVISAISRMFAEWMVKRMLMLVFNKSASIQEGTTDAAAKAPGALMSSISSYGVAAIVGIAALLAAMAAIGGGFESGGYTGNGATHAPAGLVHGKEFVLNAGAVNKYGLPLLTSMNAQATRSWEAGQPMAPAGRGMGAVSSMGQPESGGKKVVNVVMVDNRNAARDYLRTAEGEAHLVDVVRRNSLKIGVGS